MNFLIFCVYLPCLLCRSNEICCKKSAYSAGEFLQISRWEGCTLCVGVNEVTFVHALRNCMIFSKERRPWYSLCRMSWSVRFAFFFS